MEFQMEAGEIRTYNFEGTMGTSSGHVNPAAPPAQAEHFCGLRFDPSPESSAKKNGNASPQISPENNAPPSVSNCYVFKSRLQEYAQRAGLTTPVYETIKEGPSHEPFFRSTVIVNNVRYDSLPGFFHRKAAEQSAAEVALVEISRTTEAKFGITVPVHETGLCKNLLQEYAQKMNYAIPLYECTKEEKQGRTRNSNSTYFCTIEIGGTKYIGASASTKKEAEIKAARTALLAIQSAASASEQRTDKSVYTVVPQKKRGSDPEISTEETAAALKTKKCHFKKQQRKRTRSFLKKRDKRMKLKMSGQGAMESIVGDASLQNTTDAVKVVMVGQGGGGEVGLTDGVNSLDKAADGSEVRTDCQAVTEPSLTDFVSSQGEYSVLDHMEMKSTPSAGIHNGGLENVSVPSDGLCKDGESLKMDASVTGTGLVNMIDIRGYLSGL